MYKNIQGEIDEIFDKFKKSPSKENPKDISRLIELIASRYTGYDEILYNLDQKIIMRNTDYLLRAAFELSKPGNYGIKKSKHYVVSNLFKSSYGIEGQSRKKIFIMKGLIIEDEIIFRSSYYYFKFFMNQDKPTLLIIHKYGYTGITNFIERILLKIENDYISEYGFGIINDNVAIYYREELLSDKDNDDSTDFRLDSLLNPYMRVEFEGEISNPKWTDIEGHWFEDLWHEYTREIDKEEPEFFESNTPYSANKRIKKILDQARTQVYIIDPYINASIFDLLEKTKKNLYIRILSDRIQGNDFPEIFKRFKVERGNVEVLNAKKLHDRYIVIDNNKVYHLGSSINSFGEKATTLVPLLQTEIREKIITYFNEVWKESKNNIRE